MVASGQTAWTLELDCWIQILALLFGNCQLIKLSASVSPCVKLDHNHGCLVKLS